jgi:hypothetical protein
MEGWGVVAEGEMKEVEKNSKIGFTPVNSCMTFTLILEDGGKIAAHITVEPTSEQKVCFLLSSLNIWIEVVFTSLFHHLRNQLARRSVREIFAVGAYGCWNVELRPSFKQTDDPFKFFPIRSRKARLEQFYLPYFHKEKYITFGFDERDEERQRSFVDLIRTQLDIKPEITITLVNLDQDMNGVAFHFDEEDKLVLPSDTPHEFLLRESVQ